MNILIIGSGGREHSIAWAINQNPTCKKIFCIPGNAGMSDLGECHEIDIMDNKKIINFCKIKNIDFVIVGPEKPLSNGIIDHLNKNNINSIGPTKISSQLESSKTFTKLICDENKIPTAKFQIFKNSVDANNYIDRNDGPYVIKANGLAEGKGVLICNKKEEAKKNIIEIFDGKFGKAGKTILIEEFLTGVEVSYFILTDGKTILPLGSAQDHKRAYDNDKGPNTGGMGAFSPSPIFNKELEDKTLRKIIKPTLKHLKKNNNKFTGILYAGLIIKNGEPKLIEYNVRFGDPECQVILMRIGAQILDLFLDCANNNLENSKVNWIDNFAINVVMANKGYPSNYQNGSLISNLESLKEYNDIEVFHAGTKKVEGRILSNGGRVLNICARGKTLTKANKLVYKKIKKVNWPEGFYRKDIGKSKN